MAPDRCVKIKDFAHHATWRTHRGFHCSVAHECSAADFDDIMADLIKHGRTRRV